jgi:hypothetical protein
MQNVFLSKAKTHPVTSPLPIHTLNPVTELLKQRRSMN